MLCILRGQLNWLVIVSSFGQTPEEVNQREKKLREGGRLALTTVGGGERGDYL
jgi:hypothetical protein